jgi:Transposase DDE domain
VVESSKDEDKPGPKSKHRKRRHSNIAVDSTGIKVTNRGEWILDKWKNKRKRKGFIKIHVAVNIKTKKIVSMNVTKETIHDGERC